MIRPYYLGGITARGFVQFYDDLVSDLDYVLYIEGGFTSILNPLFQKLKEKYEKDYEIECVYNHLEPDKLEAVIIREFNVAVIDRSKMDGKKLVYPKLYEKLIYVGDGYDEIKLVKYESELRKITDEITKLYEKTTKHFKTALQYHHQTEDTYIQYLNKNKANIETEKLIDSFFLNSRLNKPSQIVHRYLGAATSKGPLDFVMDLTEDVERRIYIKGRSGTGKSTVLRKIVREAEERGFDAEIYHCGFDPSSLDMVILRELGIAIFDSTDPHEHDPERSNDEIFDSYELFIEGDPDSKHANEIKEYKTNYKHQMKQAANTLKEIRDQQREFETIYQNALEDNYMDNITEEVIKWVEEHRI